jgi:hypothetical protein
VIELNLTNEIADSEVDELAGGENLKVVIARLMASGRDLEAANECIKLGEI